MGRKKKRKVGRPYIGGKREQAIELVSCDCLLQGCPVIAMITLLGKGSRGRGEKVRGKGRE